ncbi:MAG: Hsp20/alpha crystallin family protein [bacterium]|nr:Hsp20/alpha crystallin family protein [bacterium]
MDKNTKNFFEKLAGINHREEEFQPELTKLEESSPEKSLNEIFEEAEGELAIDVYQTPSAFTIESTIAGVNPEDIDISLTSDSITIKGKREKEERIKTENYIHQECYWGRFTRSIILPQEIDPDRTQASIKNGVLKITLPKVNKTKSKKIKVRLE